MAKHRSVSKVRSTKLAKKIRFTENKILSRVFKSKHPFKQVWVSNIYVESHTDPETNVQIPAHILRASGTYIKAKHDVIIKDKHGFAISTKRYVAH